MLTIPLALTLAGPGPPPPNADLWSTRGATITAGISGGASIAWAFAAAGSAIHSERCWVEQIEPSSDNELLDGGLDFSCWPNGIGSAIGAGLSSAHTVVWSAVAGHRWARHDLAAGRRLTRKQRIWRMVGGASLRLLGAGLITSVPWVAETTSDCPEVTDGDDAQQVRQHMRCYSGRALGATSLAAVGFAMRWAGAGLFTHAIGHEREARRTALTPFAAPSGRALVVGLQGRF